MCVGRSINKIFLQPQKEIKEFLFSNFRKTGIPSKFMEKSNATLGVNCRESKDYTLEVVIDLVKNLLRTL